MAKRRPRILVVDDDANMRSILQFALRDDGYEVHVETDGVSIDHTAQKFRPDLAILDVRLPVGPDGYAIAKTIRSVRDLPILFLTGADSMESRLAAFDAGADDYLIKPFSVDELLARVRALLRQSGRLTSSSWQIGDVVIDQGSRTVVRSGEVVHLTPTEYELLCVLGRERGEVVTKAKLLSRVWGNKTHDKNLVEVHMSSLRRKLESRGGRLVHTVRGVGYVLRD